MFQVNLVSLGMVAKVLTCLQESFVQEYIQSPEGQSVISLGLS